MQKLIKINADHYIIVDDSEIREGNYFISDKIIHQAEEILDCDNDGNKEIHSQNYCNPLKFCKKITHSTPNVGGFSALLIAGVKELSHQEVKELIGEVDVEKIAEHHIGSGYSSYELVKSAFIAGYNQSLEDNKEKKYTEEDMKECVMSILRDLNTHNEIDKPVNFVWTDSFKKHIQTLQLKTEWDVEIIDGELKLKQ